MKLALCLLASAAALAAQVPTITSITVDSGATDNSSFRVFVTLAAPAWTNVKYGTSSGVYPYQTRSLTGNGSTQLSFAVGGLAANTTYYVTATARPNPNDDTNICNASSCGATEITVTTTGGIVPSLPIPPATWALTHPDTSGYTVVPMGIVTTGITNECGAKSNVTSPDGWTVTAGDLIPAVLTKVGYGSVLEFDQGAGCVVNPSYTGNNRGYIMPSKAIDPNASGNVNSSLHRWIVLRTKSLNAADFPPFGVRTGPQWASKMAKFYVQAPPPPDTGAGQAFDANNSDGGITTHIWFENLEFTPIPSYANPIDSVDPVAFAYPLRFGSKYAPGLNSYDVFDRLYVHGGVAPLRQFEAFEFGGNYQAMLSCYISKIETWRMTAWPSNSGSVSGSVITVPQNQFRFQAATAMLGMSGSSTFTLTSGAAGSFVGALYKNHLDLVSQTGLIFSCSGSSCTTSNSSSPTAPYNALSLFRGSVSGGVISITDWATTEDRTSRYVMAFGIQFIDPPSNSDGPYLFDNNYIDGVGEGFYVDADYSSFAHPSDVTYTRNHHIWPKNYFQNDPGWVGWRYEVRQHWEAKRGRRISLVGNIFGYYWSFQNEGPAIFLSGRPQYNPQTLNSGLTDVTIKSNIMRHGRSGINCSAMADVINGGNSSDAQIVSRLNFSNNLMYDLGNGYWCDPVNCPGVQSPYFSLVQGCQNVTIKNNTGGPIVGSFPVWLYVGGGTALGNYLDFENNVLSLQAGSLATSPTVLNAGIWGNWLTSPNYTGHLVSPDPSASYSQNFNTSFTSIPNYKAILDASFIQAAATGLQTAKYTWKNNVAVGGPKGAYGGLTDMSAANVAALQAKMPTGDQYPAGETIAARQAAIAFRNPAANDYRITGATVYNAGGGGAAGLGVDHAQLYADAGIVSNIQTPLVSSGSAKFQYQAPDARACSVDVSGDSWATWTRTTDSGGAIARSVTVSGLSASTTYQSRILCYFEQVNDGVLYTEWLPSEITRATLGTVASAATSTTMLQFSFPTVPAGATQLFVTLTPVTGSVLTYNCTSSPCSISAPLGDYSMALAYKNSGGTIIAPGKGATLTIR